jgi:hypothetical protein
MACMRGKGQRRWQMIVSGLSEGEAVILSSMEWRNPGPSAILPAVAADPLNSAAM